MTGHVFIIKRLYSTFDKVLYSWYDINMRLSRE